MYQAQAMSCSCTAAGVDYSILDDDASLHFDTRYNSFSNTADPAVDPTADATLDPAQGPQRGSLTLPPSVAGLPLPNMQQ